MLTCEDRFSVKVKGFFGKLKEPVGIVRVMKSRETDNFYISFDKVSALLGEGLISRLAKISSHRSMSVYLTGGTVRDLVMGRIPKDIDLTVREDAKGWAAEFAEMTGGTLVRLGRNEDAARVVWKGRDIDFSSYREGAVTIEEELTKRDITINSMAFSLREILENDLQADAARGTVFDPSGGLDDIENKSIRAVSKYSFRSDPLRMLRVFRFAAILDFTVEDKTRDMIIRQKEWIAKPAKERVASELDLVMGSERACATFQELVATGLLFEIVPELKPGVGMDQPSSHHLDVFEHSMAALQNMEMILANPGRYFPGKRQRMNDYINSGRHYILLKWAALLHDVGKPPTLAIDEDRGGRITFYNHDHVGARLVSDIARRFCWSRDDEKFVADLVSRHMRPFFLSNVRRDGNLSLKACLKLLKVVQAELPGLFLLSMADSLAGKGVSSPDEMEREIADLFDHLEEIRENRMEPVRSMPPLLTGKDLIEELELAPGPLFRKILEYIEEEHMAGTISSRGEGLALARKFIKESGSSVSQVRES